MIIGVQITYDESPLWVMSSITSVAPVLDHLVVVDGGYALFPGTLNRPASRVETQQAVIEACAATDLALTYYKPTTAFIGNEVEKRQLSVDLALLVSESDSDWLLVFDTDNTARYLAPDVREILAGEEAQQHHVASYAVYNSFDAQRAVDEHGFDPSTAFGSTENADPVRGLYRAIPGLRYGPAHYWVSAPINGVRTWLWGQPRTTPYADALDVTPVLQFNHRRAQRALDRADAARRYYQLRDSVGAEKIAQVWVEGLDGEPCPVA